MKPAWCFFCRRPITCASEELQFGPGTRFGPHPALRHSQAGYAHLACSEKALKALDEALDEMGGKPAKEADQP